MATKTSNYEFNKPEQNDFYDVDVQNENWDKVDEELSEFDDSGVTEDIKSFPDFLSKFVTGNKVAITLRNLKAGLQFVLHAGQIVNNCVTDNTGLPLSAAQGKALKDLIDTTNNNLSNKADATSLSSYALKSDLEAVKSKQINRYTSAENNTDTVLSSYENKAGNFILQFTSNETTGTIPTLTSSHLFIIEHFMVGDNSDSAIERAYSVKGKLIAWRFKQWWNKTWTAWENS